MRAYIALILLLIASYSFADKRCWATGDPHYKSYDGFNFDMYGVTGDSLVTRSDDGSFQVLARVQYCQFWENRGLQTAVSVVVDGNNIEHFGSYYKVNGKKNDMSALKNNVLMQITGNLVYIKSRVSEARVEYRVETINNGAQKGKWPEYYFNIYVDIPDKFYGHMSGLCGNGRGPAKEDQKNFADLMSKRKPTDKFFKVVVPPTDSRNTFDLTFVPDKSVKVTKVVQWPSQEMKLKAYEYCGNKLKLTEPMFHDCLFDIKVSGGDTEVAASYKEAVGDMEELKAKAEAWLKQLDLDVSKLEKTDKDLAETEKKVKVDDNKMDIQVKTATDMKIATDDVIPPEKIAEIKANTKKNAKRAAYAKLTPAQKAELKAKRAAKKAAWAKLTPAQKAAKKAEMQKKRAAKKAAKKAMTPAQKAAKKAAFAKLTPAQQAAKKAARKAKKAAKASKKAKKAKKNAKANKTQKK